MLKNIHKIMILVLSFVCTINATEKTNNVSILSPYIDKNSIDKNIFIFNLSRNLWLRNISFVQIRKDSVQINEEMFNEETHKNVKDYHNPILTDLQNRIFRDKVRTTMPQLKYKPQYSFYETLILGFVSDTNCVLIRRMGMHCYEGSANVNEDSYFIAIAIYEAPYDKLSPDQIQLIICLDKHFSNRQDVGYSEVASIMNKKKSEVVAIINGIDSTILNELRTIYGLYDNGFCCSLM